MDDPAFLAAATAFTDAHIRPNAASWEADPLARVKALKAAAKAGLLKLDTPVASGGFGLPFSTKLRFCEALARGDFAFAFSLINSQNVAAKLAASGAAFSGLVEQIMAGNSFGGTALTEPGMGSDFTAIETTAEKVDGGWRLNGEKAWITNADIADWFLVYAQTKTIGDRSGIASFLVHSDDPGFQRGAPTALLGGHAIGAGGFQMRDLLVPDSRALSASGDGFKQAMGGVNSARVYVAAMCVGIVSDALDQATAYAQTRTAFGKPLMAHQGLRWSLSDVATELAAMRALTDAAGRAVEAEADAILLAAQAKKFATERAVRLIERCMQSMGAQGLSTANSLGRHLIAAKIAGYTDGSIEMMNERVGASLLKK